MNRDDYIRLIYKRLKGEISPDEQSRLDQWLDASPENASLQENITKDWELSALYEPDISMDATADFKALQKRIRDESRPKAKVVPMRSRRSWLVGAAAVALLLTTSWWFWSKGPAPQTLILASTAADETKEIQLPDGTKVWLNQNSRVEYPESFAADVRQVRLSGEGFFQVQHQANQPFIIDMPSSSVTVLGTSFNLRAYPDEPFVEVVVEEGKVRLQGAGKKDALILERGRKGVFELDSQKLIASDHKRPNASAWRNKVLVFRDMPLQKAIEDLERLFKIEVEITNPAMVDCPVTGRFPDASAEGVLTYLSDSFGMEMEKISANQYALRQGVCR